MIGESFSSLQVALPSSVNLNLYYYPSSAIGLDQTSSVDPGPDHDFFFSISFYLLIIINLQIIIFNPAIS
jgi:hypothetical protein